MSTPCQGPYGSITMEVAQPLLEGLESAGYVRRPIPGTRRAILAHPHPGRPDIFLRDPGCTCGGPHLVFSRMSETPTGEPIMERLYLHEVRALVV